MDSHILKLAYFYKTLMMDFICLSKTCSLEHCLNYCSYTEVFYEKKEVFLVHRVHLNSVLNCRVYKTQCWETLKKPKRFQRKWDTEMHLDLQELTLVMCIENSCHINNSKSLVFSSTFWSFLVILFPHCSNSPSENQTNIFLSNISWSLAPHINCNVTNSFHFTETIYIMQ